MKRNAIVVGMLSLGLLLAVQVHAASAQKSGKTLSLIYSNNINGEIEPCPS